MIKRKYLFLQVAVLWVGMTVAQSMTPPVQPVDSLLILNNQLKELSSNVDYQQAEILELRNQQADNFQSLPLTLAVLALVISVSSLIIVLMKKNGKNTSTQEVAPGSSAGGKDDKKETYLVSEVRRLESNLVSANKRMDQLASAIADLKHSDVQPVVQRQVSLQQQVQQQVQQQTSNNQKRGGVGQFQKQVFYADLLESDGIAVDDLKANNSEYMLLKIIVIGPTEAQFEVNNLSSAQQTLVSSYKFTIGNFVNSTSNSNSAQRIVTRTPGRLRLQGDRWVLDSKADIVLE